MPGIQNKSKIIFIAPKGEFRPFYPEEQTIQKDSGCEQTYF